jgi:hypothetical protein
MSTLSINRWYLLQEKCKMPEETCVYKCWLSLFASFLEKSSFYYPLSADKFYLKEYRS